MILLGFKSRCTKPKRWISIKAVAIDCAISITCFCVSCLHFLKFHQEFVLQCTQIQYMGYFHEFLCHKFQLYLNFSRHAIADVSCSNKWASHSHFWIRPLRTLKYRSLCILYFVDLAIGAFANKINFLKLRKYHLRIKYHQFFGPRSSANLLGIEVDFSRWFAVYCWSKWYPLDWSLPCRQKSGHQHPWLYTKVDYSRDQLDSLAKKYHNQTYSKSKLSTMTVFL